MSALGMVKHILIVDDDASILYMLCKRLESQGYHCASASSVEEALQKVKQQPPDLVILDLGFKKADGTSFLKTLDEWVAPGQKLPPVIVLSGMQSQEIIDYVMDLGAAAFLSKPYDSGKLLSIVEQYVH